MFSVYILVNFECDVLNCPTILFDFYDFHNPVFVIKFVFNVVTPANAHCKPKIDLNTVRLDVPYRRK